MSYVKVTSVYLREKGGQRKKRENGNRFTKDKVGKLS